MPRVKTEPTDCTVFMPVVPKKKELTGVFSYDNHECCLQAFHWGPHVCWCGYAFITELVSCR